jgi:hypothetical protein
VRAGKVLYPALSNHAAWQTQRSLDFQEAQGWARLQVIQPMYNLVKRQAEWRSSDGRGERYRSLPARRRRAVPEAWQRRPGPGVSSQLKYRSHGEDWMHGPRRSSRLLRAARSIR